MTGPQAEVYADHQIAFDLSQLPYGGVYATISRASQEDPSSTALAADAEKSFRGTTLRGLLLTVYGFWKLGQIAMYGAIAAFVLAGIMVILEGLGLWHSRKVPEREQLVVHDT